MHPNPALSPTALVCDVDGTITDERRRINLEAVRVLRTLIDAGVPVVLASGNTVCAMDVLCKMVGTDGTIISENGGVYRVTYQGERHVCADRSLAWDAYHTLEQHFEAKGRALELYSAEYRFADVAFARNVDVDEVRDVLAGSRVRVLDTQFAIHLVSKDVNKGTAFLHLVGEMGFSPADFMAIGDSENDVEMIRAAGVGAAVGNGCPATKAAADWVAQKRYGEGFVEAVKTFFPYFFER
ncbi:MAG: phosphoglycolate phosphatase [Methanomicrobiaceae archaeon]|nr:phosphoglycolate phosphatase [Methanomicrobiaceae archaeon]